MNAIAASARSSRAAFEPQQLANTAWACANMVYCDEPLLDSLASAALRKLTEYQTQDLQNTAWSYYMLKLGDWPLLSAISSQLTTQGARMDLGDPPGHHIAEYRWRTRSNDPWEPWISLFLRDIVVVMKPAAWQVDTDDVGTPIHRFTQWIQRRLQRAPVAHSHRHRYGIIHRLDTPSSGLICVGRTFEGYFSLMFQLSVGRIAREYCVLSCNSMTPMADVVDSKMFQWKQAGPVCAHVREDVGKAATTWFSAVAHARHTWADLSTLTFSLIAIRIGTGRRHQIRTHITHIGHPTVLDAKYADAAVWEPEAALLECKLLHRMGLQVGAPALHSRRFPSVYPQHAGLDPESLNPALMEMMGRAVPTLPLAVPAPLSIPQAKRKDLWSRDGACSKAPRRVDSEGRDKDRCMVCGQFGHWSRECPNGGKGRCLVCGLMGHKARDCPEGGDTCLFCGKIGHVQKECPQLHPGADAWTPECYDYKTEGKCKFGKKCPFRHGSLS